MTTRVTSDAPGEGSHILIIDDNLYVARSIRRTLAPARASIETEARCAIERIQAHEHFDAIVCDLQMPEIDGVAVLEAVRAHHGPAAGPLMILMSGDESLLERWRGTDVAILPKPFTPGDLRALLGPVLARGAAPGAERLAGGGR